MSAIPAVPTKGWQIVPNMPQRSTNGEILFDRIMAWCGTAYGGHQITAHPWVIVRSSNSVTAADGNVILTAANIVASTSTSGARTWAILEQRALPVGGGKYLQMLIDDQGANTTICQVFLSPSGSFTGGTTTARPTAPDELNTYGFSTSYSVTGNKNQHVWVSEDGRQTMGLTCQSGEAKNLWIVGAAEDPPSSWTRPFILYTGTCGDIGFPTACWGREIMGFSAAHPITGEALPGVNGTIRMIGECYGSGANTIPLSISSSAVNKRNQVSGGWDWYRLGQLQGEHADLWGPIGYWPDIWASATPRVGPPSFRTGDHFPASPVATRQWVKVDDVILPWMGKPAMVVG